MKAIYRSLKDIIRNEGRLKGYHSHSAEFQKRRLTGLWPNLVLSSNVLFMLYS